MSQKIHSFFVALNLLMTLSFAGGCGGSNGNDEEVEEEENNDGTDSDAELCDNSGITTYEYLMAFHACSESCTSPANHIIYLAGSDDGTAWTLIEEFEPRSGSVPDVVFYNNYLYIFHTSGSEHWVKLNACFEVVDQSTVSITSAEDSGGFVDPSLMVSGDDLILFYLPGILGQDPAGCSSYPCTKEIHSAVADDEGLATFAQIDGNRAEKTLTAGTFSDPDIVSRADGTFLLYVSSGQSTLAYSGTSLNDTFSGETTVSNNQGGVPSGIEVDGEIWLYVTTNQSGIEVIRRGLGADGVSSIDSANFETVIDATISGGFSASTNVSSPSMIVWPDESWSSESINE